MLTTSEKSEARLRREATEKAQAEFDRVKDVCEAASSAGWASIEQTIRREIRSAQRAMEGAHDIEQLRLLQGKLQGLRVLTSIPDKAQGELVGLRDTLEAMKADNADWANAQL